ncbi:MAG TPA: MarR family winged helix-turn-helix transcriptional regulator [Geminicoccaceae bacterium]|nr:MarR family winged helix-turn-helix transcriptional regulator [Geminicoccaceae bacterium]
MEATVIEAPDRRVLRLAPTEEEALRRLDNALSVFSEVQWTMPLQVAHALVRLTLNQGSSLVELAKIADQPMSNMSRHMLDLQETNRRLEPGLDLVEVNIDPNERRRKQYWLTPKGQQAVKRVLAAMGGKL